MAHTRAESDPPPVFTRPAPAVTVPPPTALPTSAPVSSAPLTYTVETGDKYAVAAQPPAAGAGPVSVRESTLTLPAYRAEPYQSDQVDPVYAWPYKRFDIERFRTEAPLPQRRTFRTLLLENDFLSITLLPELGGRILQVVHKPSGTRMFYENPVLKPTAWGPLEQGGWVALGGLEWGLPVEEHGYSWGEAWGYLPLEFSAERAAVTLFTPRDGRALNASVTVELVAGSAAFTIEPAISNTLDHAVSFDYWHNAMLAPGDGKSISSDVHIVLPTGAMMVHSSEDTRLPSAGRVISWPYYADRDVSRLQTWNEYAGLFEHPAAHGPFAAVYDTVQDAGAVRVFPADVARGSKVFALGGSRPLEPSLYTDDGSAYIELHGGLAPNFLQQANLAAGESVSWRETWYPVHGLGDLDAANELVALHVITGAGRFGVGVYAARQLDAELVLEGGEGELARAPLALAPGTSQRVTWPQEGLGERVQEVRIQTSLGAVIEYRVPHF